VSQHQSSQVGGHFRTTARNPYERSGLDVLFRSSLRSFEAISDEIRDTILESAPSATVSANGSGWKLHLGSGELRLEPPAQVRPDPWEGRGPKFEAVSFASISIQGSTYTRDYKGRSHSLWYCDALEEGDFAWHEVAFMESPFSGAQKPIVPFALPPGSSSAEAFSGVIGHGQPAWPFVALVPGDIDEFIGRWAELLAIASNGPLQHPSGLPERDARNWRR